MLGDIARQVVSIRARHRWRAIPSTVRRWQRVKWFQSAPAIDGGRSHWAPLALIAAAPVSIRARHRWRAIPSNTPSARQAPVFQSAPAIDGGRSPN